jgi:hypothetical protein
MTSERNGLRRLERFVRHRVRDPMRRLVHGRPSEGTFRPAERPNVDQDPGNQEATLLGRQILSQQAMLTHHSLNRLERSLLLQGRIAANQIATMPRIRHLGEIEFRVCSQWGEDGIIEWLCTKLPDIPRSFVEFGVENYAEANTRFLIENRGWRGLVFDGDKAHIEALRHEALYWRHDLTAAAAFITAENINSLIVDNSFKGPIGILSIDIDGNDYWVIEAIDCIDPAIIICEVNGVFGDTRAVTVPYRPDFRRMDAHYSGQYFGCSIGAIRKLCARKGYSFIGTNTNGVNAFFVRDDFASPILGAIEEPRAWPPRHRDSRDRDGQLDFVRGIARYNIVADMPVVDLETDTLVPLHSLAPLYSDSFLKDFR